MKKCLSLLLALSMLFALPLNSLALEQAASADALSVDLTTEETAEPVTEQTEDTVEPVDSPLPIENSEEPAQVIAPLSSASSTTDNYTISGTISFPAELSSYEYVVLITAVGQEANYSAYTPSTDGSYSINVPAGTYKLALSCHTYHSDNIPGLITTNVYLQTDNSFSLNADTAKEFTVNSGNLVQNMTLPVGSTTAIELTAPEGYSETYRGKLELVNLDTLECVNYASILFTGTTDTVYLTWPTDLDGSNYGLRITMSQGAGITTASRWWSNEAWSNSKDEATSFDTKAATFSLPLPPAKTLTLEVKAPSGYSGTYSGSVSLYEEGTFDHGFRFDLACTQDFSFVGSSTTLTLPVNDDRGDSFMLCIYLDSGEGVSLYSYYYSSENGWASDMSEATALTFLSGSAEITLPTSKHISLILNAPEGRSGYYEGYVRLYKLVYPNGTDRDYELVCEQPFSFTGKTTTLSLTLPESSGDSFIVGVRLDHGPGALLHVNRYYSDGWYSDLWYIGTAQDLSSGVLEITFPVGSEYFVTINAPAGYSGYYKGRVELFNSNNAEVSKCFFEFTGDSVTFNFPMEYYSGDDQFTIQLYMFYGPGTMCHVNLYYSEDGWVYDKSKATLLDFSASNHVLELSEGREVNLTLTAPDGFSGDYSGYVSLYEVITTETETNYIEATGAYFSFTGNSYSETFYVHKSSGNNFIVMVDIDEGPGVATNCRLYYSDSGWVRVESYASPLDFSTNSSIQLPASATATLTFLAPDGCSGHYEFEVHLYTNLYGMCTTYRTIYAEFDGNCCDVNIEYPADYQNGMILSILVNRGVGVLTGHSHSRYYSNGTWVKSLYVTENLDLSSNALTITMPEAKSISGKLVSAQGDTVTLSEQRVNFHLYKENGSTAYIYSKVIDEEGNFTLYVSDSLTGKFYLHCWASGTDGSNVVGNDYYYYFYPYYSLPRAVNSYDSSNSSYLFEIGTSNYTGMKLYVDTGYILTGTIETAQEATFNSSDDYIGDVQVTLSSSAYSGSYTNSVHKGESSWSYSLALPKNSTEYSVTTQLSLNAGGTSNLFLGPFDQGTITISGDTTAPVFTLPLARTTITASICSPISAESLSGNLYVVTENNTYTGAIDATDLSVADVIQASVSISPTDDADNYQLYYYLTEPVGLLKERAVYVGQDGSLTTDQAQAGTFAFSQQTEHNLTLLEGRTVLVSISNPLSHTTYIPKGTIYVVTAFQTYSQAFSFSYESRDIIEFPIDISAYDETPTYQLYYNLSYPNNTSLYKGVDVYLTQEGSFTTDATQAGTFAFSEITKHTFALAEMDPFLSGRIYLPFEPDDSSFTVKLYSGYNRLSYEISVNSSTILTDEDGQLYVPYKLYNTNETTYSSFYIYYSLSYYSGTALYSQMTTYLEEDGSISFGSSVYWKMPDSGQITLNFTLADWESGSDSALIQTEHGVPLLEEKTFVISYPGATKLRLRFDQRTDVDVTINGTTVTSYNLGGWVKTVDTSGTNGTVTLTANAYGMSKNVYGFAVTSIEPIYEEESPTTPTVVAVYTCSGSDQATVMEDITTGTTVRVTFIGEAETSGTLAAAVYDSNNRLIDIVIDGLTFDANGVATCPLSFDQAGKATTLKLMFLDVDSWIPLIGTYDLTSST